MTRIRTLLFDMGNVLVHFSHERMCRQMADVCGVDTRVIRDWLLDSDLLADFERGRLTEIDLHRSAQQLFDTSASLTDLVRAASDIFALNAPIVPLLDSLIDHGYRLVLLSNTCVSHMNWIQQEYDVLDRFDALVTSYEAGAIKPEPAIYELALNQIDCAPSECFYTDDIAAYVDAGRSFGLQAEVFTGVDELMRHLSMRGVVLP